MPVKLYGELTSPAVKAELNKALESPEGWSVYLVRGDDRKRTSAQNRLFRVLLRKFAQQQGRSVQYWHDYLVERFLGYEEVLTEDGYTRKVLCSTADLTVIEFTEFLNACLTVASENQVH